MALKKENKFPEELYVHADPFTKNGITFDAFVDPNGEEDDLMAVYKLVRVVRIRKEVSVRLEDVPNKIE